MPDVPIRINMSSQSHLYFLMDLCNFMAFLLAVSIMLYIIAILHPHMLIIDRYLCFLVYPERKRGGARKWLGRRAIDLIYGFGKSFSLYHSWCLCNSWCGEEIAIYPIDEMPGLTSKPETSPNKLCLLLTLSSVNLFDSLSDFPYGPT